MRLLDFWTFHISASSPSSLVPGLARPSASILPPSKDRFSPVFGAVILLSTLFKAERCYSAW